MVGSIENLFNSYRKRLYKERREIAVLQLTGKIENYLVGRFNYNVHLQTNGECIGYSNIGLKKEQKIDSCLVKEHAHDNEIDDEGGECYEYIYGMIEAKYIRNRHRTWHHSATDEITPSMKQLYKQVHPYKTDEHGGYDVSLSSKKNHIYGLVIGSFVATNNEMKEKKRQHFDKEVFFSKIENHKLAKNFKSHNSGKARLKSIYEDHRIKAMSNTFYSTLRVGLWVRK